MVKYTAKRILQGLFAMFILTTITFFMMKIIPGNPFNKDNKVIPAKQMAALVEKYGLDKTIMEQYTDYMKNLLKGDMGISYNKVDMTISSIIKRTAPVTAKLGMVAFGVSLVAGVTLGIVSALSKKRWVNNIITVIVTIGVSVPSFLIGIGMMILFGVKLKLFPLIGLTSPRHFVLPTIALSLSPISYITRLTRSSLRDVMNQDYITLARSKGTKNIKVIVMHGLKNALLPVITYCGPLISGLVTGSFVTESLFSIPGIGAQFVNSVNNRDYTLIMGLTIFLGLLVIVFNMLADFVSAAVDPRIKLKG
ncbi:MAG: ABC transporter permease [Eubacteriaceae bacterium]|nr:ABC transporter permease [Eubacteriaceae bacterium]